MGVPLLALDKVSKRFGAIVIADAIDLALADGEALGIIGPNGAGKTTLFGIISGGRAGCRPGALCRPRHHASAAGAALHHGHRPVVSDPAAVRRHERF
jgi:ATPase subunit of ABC transporter with duplicated ATPase domains